MCIIQPGVAPLSPHTSLDRWYPQCGSLGAPLPQGTPTTIQSELGPEYPVSPVYGQLGKTAPQWVAIGLVHLHS